MSPGIDLARLARRRIQINFGENMITNYRFDWKSTRRLLAGATFGAFLFAFGTPALRADDDDCQKRIARADHRLHEAVEHHGWDSPEAAKYRSELHEAREYCWQHSHRWWSEDDHRWHTDRDWDDHDHDHDHDHH